MSNWMPKVKNGIILSCQCCNLVSDVYIYFNLVHKFSKDDDELNLQLGCISGRSRSQSEVKIHDMKY